MFFWFLCGVVLILRFFCDKFTILYACYLALFFCLVNDDLRFFCDYFEYFLMFLRFFSNESCAFVEQEPDANEGKTNRQQNTNKRRRREGREVMERGPLPARRFPPRLREPARRTTAPASAPSRRRDTTAVMADPSGKGVAKRKTQLRS